MFRPIDYEFWHARTDICWLQTLFGAGDVLAQQVVDKKGFDKHEYARTGRMVLYGGGMPLSFGFDCLPSTAS